MFLHAHILVWLYLVSTVLSIPTWDGGLTVMRPMTSIGSLVPGASFVEAVGAVSTENYRPKYLGMNAGFGQPGPAIVYETYSPPLFFINNDQLYQVTNETSVFRVNLLNVTGVESHGVPYKLDVSERKEGLRGGTWRWQATRLFYDLGKRTNTGLYFTCPDDKGVWGVYTSLEPMKTPDQCQYHTFHSWLQRAK